MIDRKPSFDGRPVIIGAGVAGLVTAMRLAPEPVLLLSKGRLGSASSTELAQGGLAAALGDDDDPTLHISDTLAAGDGLCDRQAVEDIVRQAPAAVARLEGLGVAFDRTSNGAIALGLEAAHSRRRIVHCRGDATGAELSRALVEAVRRTCSIAVLEGVETRRLITHDGAIAGVLVVGASGAFTLPTDRVVIATGGVGGLFLDSTNPVGSFGHGLALAAHAGADLADLEFVQFHPTALDLPGRPMKLVSEAVRGDGAILVDEAGRRILENIPGAELAPRDVVARALWRQSQRGRRAFLDARRIRSFATRFPTIAAICLAAGLDPETQLIPVRPGAHYHMGGIAVDLDGRSSVPGLWACGEAACTGLHGANRLASNSLMEAVVCAARVAESVTATPARRTKPRSVSPVPPAPDPSLVQPLVSRGLGILREASGLLETFRALALLAGGRGPAADPAAIGLMMALAALRREESRGAHSRLDFPNQSAQPRRSILRLDDTLTAARELSSPSHTYARSA